MDADSQHDDEYFEEQLEDPYFDGKDEDAEKTL